MRSTSRSVLVLALALLVPAVAGAQRRTPPKRPAPVAAAPAAPARPSPTEAMLKSLHARSIGPAIMGGRVSDIALDPTDPWTFYVASAHGGLLKTTDNGGSFTGVMDDQQVSSMGAVAVAPSDAKVVWAGTGEANDRNTSGFGDGVYRSTDGGGSWTHVGLDGTRAIARIVAHPTDPKTAYVCAAGDLWNPTPERGLYKTADGGQTWKLVLSAPAPDNDKVGCGDVAIDPASPDTLYAALYARRRTSWSFTAGPAASDGKDLGGVFKSTDGGATWTKLGHGLPSETGRIGLSVYAKNPKTVYALVESFAGGTSNIDNVFSKEGGVFRSDDAGATWTRQSPLDPRPFYFSQIRVDPQDDQKVYVLGFMLHVSEDGGKTFREDRFKDVHSDCHALALDPRRPERMLLGTDGGVYQTYDRGAHWTHIATAAIAEYYRIVADDSTPYRVCGGLQDNLNWLGPSATRTSDGVTNGDWTNIYGGDGFYCVFDPADPNIVYAESQEGYAHRLNLASGAVKELRPEPAEGQPGFRFNWNSPFIASRHQPGLMYLAGNRVFALTDRGDRWRPISPDLSGGLEAPQRILTTGSGAENYAVVFALAESPVKAGELWAGTDDGRLWVTEDQGGHWSDLTAHLPAAAKAQRMERIEPSYHDAATAYLVVSAFRTGDYAPLVYRTTDMGQTWQSVAGDLPKAWPARVVREDPSNPDLLFAGTEIGLYVSFDRGATWRSFGGLPTVPVDDILIHPREHDLIVATHGRSLFIVDDIRPLEQLTPAVMDEKAHLFPVADAYGYEPLPGWVDSAGTSVFRGQNPPVGARIDVWVKDYTGDKISVSIKSPEGLPVANLSAPGLPGFNRLVWDLKPTKDVLTEYGGEGQKFVHAGEYEVTLSYGGVTQTQKVKVTIAPGIETR